MTGYNFGQYADTDGMRIGFSPAGLTKWIADSAIRCRALSGRGSSSSIRLTSVLQQASISEILTYGLPVVSAMNPNTVSTGAVYLSVQGTYFQQEDTTASMGVGASECESTLWVSSSLMTCRVPSGGNAWAGSPRKTVITISRAVGSLSDALSYHFQGISSPSPPNGPTETMEWSVCKRIEIA